MVDDYQDPKGIVHREQIVQTADNIVQLDSTTDRMSIDIGVMRERTKDCHERAERLAKAAQEAKRGV